MKAWEYNASERGSKNGFNQSEDHQMKRTLLLLFLAVVISGCEPGSGGTITIHRGQMGEEWPLTVERCFLSCDCVDLGFLHCESAAVTIHVDGTTYSVNGVGRPGLRAVDIDPIRRPDPQSPSSKVDLAPLIERGLALS